MTSTANLQIALLILLCAASPARAGTCADDIAKTQIQLDQAIEKDAGAHGWQRESLSALRSHQPTPRSIAEAEGGRGAVFTDALDSLDRARTADQIGDTGTCSRELAHVRDILK
ncbi:hypothetical protein [Bradyrhizobium liaoningense]|uniref:hypothetical protein n=1 Tax=Bradyrhizobium liaoningense TaxID=43992 RepID=UPI001BAAF166|nr:hypothetical protein [Bradyrhizobium liaoningense]MBR0816732.1 hypothetical protein [Bradyrhizobium liaoningense]